MIISQILGGKASGNIETISPDETIENAAKVLSEKRIGALIVSRDGKTIAGILSERDVVRDLGKTGAKSLTQKVSDLMTANVSTIEPDASGEKALGIMTKGRFRHMPVVDGGTLIGVISIGDVVSARLKEIEAENSALASFVAGNS